MSASDSPAPSAATPAVVAHLQARIAQLEQENSRLQAAATHAQQDATFERQRLYTVFDQVPALIDIFEGPDHVVTYFHPLNRLIMGDRDPRGVPVRAAFPELETQGYFALLDQVYTTGQSVQGIEGPATFHRPDGTVQTAYFTFSFVPWRESDGRIGGVLIFAIDVTTHIRAKQQAEESARQFRMLAETMPQMVWLTDPDGTLRYFNERWFAYVGSTPEETYGQQWLTVLHPDDGPRVSNEWRQGLRTGAAFTTEFRLRAADGSYRWFLSRSVPFRDSSGQIVQWVGTATDIADQKRAEAEQIELNALKDQFLSIASHDLRTPITAIKGYAQLLARNLHPPLPQSGPAAAPGTGSADSDKNGRIVTAIVQQSNRMAELITHLLDVSRIEAGYLTLDLTPDADLVELVQMVVGHLRVTSETHTLTLDPTTPAVVYATYDAARIEQVLTNIIGNAIRYSPEGSTVTIGVDERPAAGDTHKTAPDATTAVIWVRDEGPGISVDQQAHLFERFYQGPDSAPRGGLGLGLYIAHSIVAQHGGRVWVESAPGMGSTFCIAVPTRPPTPK